MEIMLLLYAPCSSTYKISVSDAPLAHGKSKHIWKIFQTKKKNTDEEKI